MDEEPRPSWGLRIMGGFVVLFVLALLVVLPITLGNWDSTGVVIAVGGVLIVGVVAVLAIRRASRKKPPSDESGD